MKILRERRFVILEGPPGTGKTRLAYQIADRVGSATRVQFHAARTASGRRGASWLLDLGPSASRRSECGSPPRRGS